MAIPFANRKAWADLPDLSLREKPSFTMTEIHDEFSKVLRTPLSNVFECIQVISRSKLCLTFVDKPRMEETMNLGLEFRGHLVSLTPLHSKTWITVSRVQFGVPWEAVKAALIPYGSIDRSRRESLNNVSTGSISVLMQLTSPIPSKLTVVSRTCFVFYRGQPRTCFKCGESGHQKDTCPRNAPRSDSMNGLPSSSTWGNQQSRDLVPSNANLDVSGLSTGDATTSVVLPNTSHSSESTSTDAVTNVIPLVSSPSIEPANTTASRDNLIISDIPGSSTTVNEPLPASNHSAGIIGSALSLISDTPDPQTVLEPIGNMYPTTDTSEMDLTPSSIADIPLPVTSSDEPDPPPVRPIVDNSKNATNINMIKNTNKPAGETSADITNDQMDQSDLPSDSNDATPSHDTSYIKRKTTLSRTRSKKSAKNNTHLPTSHDGRGVSKTVVTHRSLKRLKPLSSQSSSQNATATSPAPWLRKSTKPSIPPNPSSKNPFNILEVQPTTEESVDEMSDEESQSDAYDPTLSEGSSENEESSSEESEEEIEDYTPLIDKTTGQLIVDTAPKKGTIPNPPFLSSTSFN